MNKLSGKEIIEGILSELGIKAPTFASNIGVDYQRIFDIQREKTKKISSSVANSIITHYPQFNIQWLLSGEGDMLVTYNSEVQAVHSPDAPYGKADTRPRIPLNAAAGSVSVALSGVGVAECEEMPFIQAFANYNYTILVKGDSMEPEFHSGDELACLQLNGKARFIQWGRYHVLDTAQGVLVKRIYEKGEFILCKSDNHDLYPDFEIHKEEVYNLGLVIGMLRRY